MYNCAVRFLFVDCPDQFMELVREIPPLSKFEHEFEIYSSANQESISRADVVVAGPDSAEKDLWQLLENKQNRAQLLLLRYVHWRLPQKLLENVTDIWPWPESSENTRFHFEQWQKNFKQWKDLEENRQFLQCLMDTTPNLVWYKRKDGIHELVNRAFCRVVDKTRDDVQGKSHAYIWNVEQEDPACIESERIVMESGKMNVSEEEIETGAGTRFLKTYKSPLRDDDGTMMGTLGIGVDITREINYRDDLVRNTIALESLFTSMDCGVLTQSIDGKRILGANRTALRLLGAQSLEDLREGFDTIARTVVEKDKDKLLQVIGRLKNAGDNVSYEYKVKHDNGDIIHIMGNAKLIEQDGELVCQRFLLDCTAQKKAEEKEEEERNRWQRELVRALCVDYQLVCVFDARTGTGEVLQLLSAPDPELAKIFSGDTPLREKFAHYARQCVHPDERQACEELFTFEALKQKLVQEKIYYFNYRVLCGTEIHYFQLKAVRGGLVNETFSIVIGLQSVDARARYEMEQKNRLRDALAQANKASEAKSVFLSNMSHDIRTPMNAISGYTALALNQLHQPDLVKEYLDKIGASCGHLISLINDILDMSHIESGKLQLEEKQWNLRDLLGELWNIVQPTADAKTQILTLNLEIREVWIYCDKLRLNQILLNILSNAIKYTPVGGQIEMNVKQLPSPNANECLYEFEVTDNGIGMSEEFLEKLFLPFERARSSTLTGIQGTGLGMAITSKLVRVMRGEIEVRSKIDVGTDFIFRVPFRVAQPNSICGSEADESAAEAAGLPAGLDFCRVLLAEDNFMNQEIASEFLQSAGYAVEIAENGRQAVDMLSAAPAGYYNVVLMDVQMPVMDGYSATELIRGLPNQAQANVPILAMTANSFEEDRQEALARGMNGHIAKPIDFKILFGTLDKLLGCKN